MHKQCSSSWIWQFVCDKPAEERERETNIHPKVRQPVLYLQQWIRAIEHHVFKPTMANYLESFNQQSPHEPPLKLGQFTLEQGSWKRAADVCLIQSKAGTRVCPAVLLSTGGASEVRPFVDDEAEMLLGDLVLNEQFLRKAGRSMWH